LQDFIEITPELHAKWNIVSLARLSLNIPSLQIALTGAIMILKTASTVATILPSRDTPSLHPAVL
jgi:hypothetical protein